MKFQFSHQGKQFFFITLVLEERPNALSRLVGQDAPPELTPAGEVVVAFLRALHAVFPCATVSNRVIMPDHVHFLLMVDYAQYSLFNPLWTSHILMDAIEEAWAQTRPVEAESLLRKALENGRKNAHDFALYGKENLAEKRGLGGATPVSFFLRFNRSIYIERSFDPRQLQAIRRYIKLNPARAHWKQQHPNRFVRISGIRHPVLDPARTWDAMGDPTLLGSPFLLHVRLTLKKTVAEHEETLRELLEKAQHGTIPVSGFISPGEIELLRRLKATPGTRFIKMLPYALPPEYDPSAEDSRELAANRLLLLSCFRETPALTASTFRNNPAAAHTFRVHCLAMNEAAATLCTRAQALR